MEYPGGASSARRATQGTDNIRVESRHALSIPNIEPQVVRPAGQQPVQACSIVADLTPVPALPMAGAIALAVLLLVGGVRRWAAS